MEKTADLEDLTSRIGSLSPALQRVGHFIDRNRFDVMTKSAAELGIVTGTSDATVIRAVQALGFSGLSALRRALRDAFNAEGTLSTNFTHTLTDLAEGAEDAIDSVFGIHLETLASLSGGPGRERIAAAVALLARAERIVVFGLGPSGHLAGYAALSLARAGRAAFALTAGGTTLADELLALRRGDALLVLAHGRAYGEAGAAIAEARRLGVPVAVVTDSLDERLAARAEVVVPVMRGRAGRVALNGAAFVCLEAIVLGVSAVEPARSLGGLTRLESLRRSIGGGWTELLAAEESAAPPAAEAPSRPLPAPDGDPS